VLFSEPKIPQFAHPFWRSRLMATVSVLFSEPKIPQSEHRPCLPKALPVFQCSSASRKFLNKKVRPRLNRPVKRFSALQRAENSSIRRLGQGA